MYSPVIHAFTYVRMSPPHILALFFELISATTSLVRFMPLNNSRGGPGLDTACEEVVRADTRTGSEPDMERSALSLAVMHRDTMSDEGYPVWTDVGTNDNPRKAFIVKDLLNQSNEVTKEDG